MSIFGRIKSAILGSAAAKESSKESSPTPAAAAPPAQEAAASAPATASAAGTAAPMAQVDVEGVLTNLAARKGQQLDWRKSIVDLMKLLDLDSSLAARKELANELNYTGDTSDSASMNVWLHKQVMSKLAASGGKVPDDLRT